MLGHAEYSERFSPVSFEAEGWIAEDSGSKSTCKLLQQKNYFCLLLCYVCFFVYFSHKPLLWHALTVASLPHVSPKSPRARPSLTVTREVFCQTTMFSIRELRAPKRPLSSSPASTTTSTQWCWQATQTARPWISSTTTDTPWTSPRTVRRRRACSRPGSCRIRGRKSRSTSRPRRATLRSRFAFKVRRT